MRNAIDSSRSGPQISVGVIGLGKMGLVHAATLRTHPSIRLTALCDTAGFVLNAMKTFMPGVRVFNDYASMLKNEPLDAVFVTTPTGSHGELSVEVAGAGKHLFVEKPLASTLSDAQHVADVVTRNEVKSQVGYVCRYAPTFEAARKVLQSGALGRILNFGSVKYSSDVQRKVERSWRFMRRPSQGGGGVVNEFACHAVDLLVWFFGEPRSVSARMESWYSSEVEDYVHATFHYDGFSGWLDSSWSMQDYRKPYNRIDVTGDNGKLTVTDSELRYLVVKSHAGYAAGGHSANATSLYQPVRFFVGDIMFTRQTDHFVASLQGADDSRSPVLEALKTQRVIEAIRQGSCA